MKLRNKKTGEIRDFIIKKDKIQTASSIGGWEYTSLANLCKEWEDYEEPKEYWFIDSEGTIIYEPDDKASYHNYRKQIGNYFETYKEAEKAVEKLKTWKRLKDKGFKFTLTPGVGSLDVTPGKFQIEINAEMPSKWFCCDAVQEDLDTCFGGE